MSGSSGMLISLQVALAFLQPASLIFKKAKEKTALFAEMSKKPKYERKTEAEQKACNDREVESGVFATTDDVAGKVAETEGELSTEIQKSAQSDNEPTKNEEGAAEFAERVHPGILPEIAEKLFPPKTAVSLYILVLTSGWISDKYNTH
jgi:hypothetical protein